MIERTQSPDVQRRYREMLGANSRTSYEWKPEYESFFALSEHRVDRVTLEVGALAIVEGTEHLQYFLARRREYCSSMFALGSYPGHCTVCVQLCRDHNRIALKRRVPNIFWDGLDPFLNEYLAGCLQARSQVSRPRFRTLSGHLQPQGVADRLGANLVAEYESAKLSDGTPLPPGFIEHLPMIMRGAALFASAVLGNTVNSSQLQEHLNSFVTGYKQRVINPFCDWNRI